jgi:hypothetical protein
VSQRYNGPPPYYGSRFYGKRLLLARQVRGRSRAWLARQCSVPAHVIRAMERADLTGVPDERLRSRFIFALDFPMRWFAAPPFEDGWPDQKDVHFCESLERRLCCCGGEATLLCDAPVDDGTCDAPLCPDCTTKDGERDLCPAHTTKRPYCWWYGTVRATRIVKRRKSR